MAQAQELERQGTLASRSLTFGILALRFSTVGSVLRGLQKEAVCVLGKTRTSTAAKEKEKKKLQANVKQIQDGFIFFSEVLPIAFCFAAEISCLAVLLDPVQALFAAFLFKTNHGSWSPCRWSLGSWESQESCRQRSPEEFGIEIRATLCRDHWPGRGLKVVPPGKKLSDVWWYDGSKKLYRGPPVFVSVWFWIQ